MANTSGKLVASRLRKDAEPKAVFLMMKNIGITLFALVCVVGSIFIAKSSCSEHLTDPHQIYNEPGYYNGPMQQHGGNASGAMGAGPGQGKANGKPSDKAAPSASGPKSNGGGDPSVSVGSKG